MILIPFLRPLKGVSESESGVGSREPSGCGSGNTGPQPASGVSVGEQEGRSRPTGSRLRGSLDGPVVTEETLGPGARLWRGTAGLARRSGRWTSSPAQRYIITLSAWND